MGVSEHQGRLAPPRQGSRELLIRSTWNESVRLPADGSLPVIHVEKERTSLSIQLIAKEPLKFRDQHISVLRRHGAELLQEQRIDIDIVVYLHAADRYNLWNYRK